MFVFEINGRGFEFRCSHLSKKEFMVIKSTNGVFNFLEKISNFVQEFFHDGKNEEKCRRDI